jgi:hypothetical protein
MIRRAVAGQSDVRMAIPLSAPSVYEMLSARGRDSLRQYWNFAPMRFPAPSNPEIVIMGY